jgi:hypothetical protein
MKRRTCEGNISHTPYPRWARLLITYCGIGLARLALARLKKLKQTGGKK